MTETVVLDDQSTPQSRDRGRSLGKQRNSNLNTSKVYRQGKIRKFKTDKYLHNGTLKTGSFHITPDRFVELENGGYYLDGWYFN